VSPPLHYHRASHHPTRSPAIVSPSKVFLWALEKQESEASSVASSQGKQYKSALQLYDVHASGLQLLDTLSDKAFKGEGFVGLSGFPDTWMSKIFPVLLPPFCKSLKFCARS
jgi:hypothetical protein